MTVQELINQYIANQIILKKEEDVREGFTHLIRSISDVAGFSLKFNGHEVVSAFGGSADSVFDNVIFEYKAPNKFRTKKGIDEALYGRTTEITDRGLFHYLVNFSLDEAKGITNEEFVDILKDKVGVAFDGYKFVFARFVESDQATNLYDDLKTKEFPKNISVSQHVKFLIEPCDDFESGIKKLILILRSTHRSKLSGSILLQKFGPESDLCRNTLNQIYSNLCQNLKNNLRVSTLYNEWNRIFGDIYGEIETDFTKIKGPICKFYGLPENIEIRKTLFTIQTYYNLILKLLISDLFASLKDPAIAHKIVFTKNELNLLFSGRLSNDYKVDNFFEINYFEWFLYAVGFDQNIISNILLEIQTIETAASVIRPEIVEDAFRDMYEGLMPTQLRHLMGEYYTPGWLVDFVLSKSGYFGQKETTILDPCCGSGTFISKSIQRFKKANSDLDINESIDLITKNIVGYDINPIAVIQAKTNYLLSLGDISNYSSHFSIPIYMCDSILVPTVHAKQMASNKSIKVKTIVGEFELPVFKTRNESDLFLKEVSKCVESYSFDDFMKYLNQNFNISFYGVNIDVTRKFYDKVCELHLTSKDGYWGIILKNSFAPLFAKGGFDIVVGNPPWIAWKAMSDTYRIQTLDIWLSYGIFEKSAYDKITTHDDFAMAVTYVSIDHYCKANGKVCFVLPQTFLKASKGGEGFRKFKITRDGQNTPFAVDEVFDMDEIKPFRGFASNRASVVLFKKNKEMTYPMNNYFVCKPKKSEIVRSTDSYEVALSKFTIEQKKAVPIKADDLRSPWLTLSDEELSNSKKYLGASDYSGRKGIEPCGAKGIYLVDIISEKDGLIKIKNIIERSRLEEAKKLGIHEGYVEKGLIYPLVGGRNIEKWGICSNLYIVLPHYSSGSSIYSGIPESELKVKFPNTFNWLYYFHDLLLSTRITSGKFFNPKTQPFYRLDNVGPYTFSPYYVVWREQNKTMVSCVLGDIDTKFLGKKKAVVDSKVLFCPLSSKEEAYYLCGILNSATIAHIIDSYTISTNRGIDVLKNIRIPLFSALNKVHKKISDLSIQAHINHDKGLSNQDIELQIDNLIPEIFVEHGTEKGD